MTATTDLKHDARERRAILTQRWLVWMAMASTAFWMTIFAGCTTNVVTIPADRAVVPVAAGATFTATNGPGWFVPSARMLEMLQQLERSK
jgi:putative Ca2+/H+ antiporter (TMEM165/GDT1 family)